MTSKEAAVDWLRDHHAFVMFGASTVFVAVPHRELSLDGDDLVVAVREDLPSAVARLASGGGSRLAIERVRQVGFLTALEEMRLHEAWPAEEN